MCVPPSPQNPRLEIGGRQVTPPVAPRRQTKAPAKSSDHSGMPLATAGDMSIRFGHGQGASTLRARALFGRGRFLPGIPHPTIWLLHHMVHSPYWLRETVVSGDFEWEADKATANLLKHGISFMEAVTVLVDPNVLFIDDGGGTDRLVAIGLSDRIRVLYVVHLERGDRDRIVSARKATTVEEFLYAKG